MWCVDHVAAVYVEATSTDSTSLSLNEVEIKRNCQISLDAETRANLVRLFAHLSMHDLPTTLPSVNNKEKNSHVTRRVATEKNVSIDLTAREQVSRVLRRVSVGSFACAKICDRTGKTSIQETCF